MSPLTEPLSRPALPQVEGAGDFSIREYEQVAGAITETGTSYGRPRVIRGAIRRKNYERDGRDHRGGEPLPELAAA